MMLKSDMDQNKLFRWNIICVDDNADTIDIMATAAMAFPHVMFYLHHTKAGGERTLARRNYNVDAVVLDISLEDGSGREATDAIREKEPYYGHPKQIEIFWYTGWPIDLNNSYDPMVQTFYACGVQTIFRKPFPPSEMFRHILTSLDIPLEG